MSNTKLTQKDVAKMLNIPASSIAEYEKEGYYVPSNILIKYCQVFNVSADYLLGLTNNLKQPNFEIHELGLSDALGSILKDIKYHHKDDLSTSDYQNGESDFKDLVNATIDQLDKHDKKIGIGAVVRSIFLKMLHIKNSDSNMDRVAKINNFTEFDKLIEQSPIVEPDDRKRRKNNKLKQN